jgi:hypothetical protein
MKPPTLMIGVLVVLVMSLPLVSRGQQTPSVDPKADEVLKKMGATLAAAKDLSFAAHAIVDQAQADGQKVQYARNQKVQLRRPDRLAVDVTGDVEQLQFRYDGKQIALYNPATNSWGAAKAPGSIEDTLDMLARQYGMVMPLADLAFSDPYKCLTEHVSRGEYVGMGYVFDTKCHHLAFRQPSVDWQIWIEEGERALPRKIVITQKDMPAHPQYTAFLSDWNLSAKVDDAAFTLKPPADAKKVEFAPSTQPAPAAGAAGAGAAGAAAAPPAGAR